MFREGSSVSIGTAEEDKRGPRGCSFAVFPGKTSGEWQTGVDVRRGDIDREPGVVIVGEKTSSGGGVGGT